MTETGPSSLACSCLEELVNHGGVDVDEGGAANRAVQVVVGMPGGTSGQGDWFAGRCGGGDGASEDDAVTGRAGVAVQSVAGAGAVQVPGELAELLVAERGELRDGVGELAGGEDAPSPLGAEGDGVAQATGRASCGGQPRGGAGERGHGQDGEGGGKD